MIPFEIALFYVVVFFVAVLFGFWMGRKTAGEATFPEIKRNTPVFLEDDSPDIFQSAMIDPIDVGDERRATL